MAASEQLFSKLADALSQPSHAYRAAQAGLSIPSSFESGYLAQKDYQQKVDQYRLLSTPLGSMYPNPSQIPFGLGPQHTVKDLLTIAPAMENYVPSDVIKGAAQSFGANVNGDGPPPSSAPPPSVNPAPLGGVGNQSNPSGPPGTANLDAIQGTGAGMQNNVPRGTPAVVGGGPSVNVPPGGMSMKGFQGVVLPALKAGQESSQFQQNQGREASQFATGQANEFQRQRNMIQAENNRTMAGETAKIAPSLTEAETISDDINALKPLFLGSNGNTPYKPIPFLGSTGANIAAKSGSSTFGTPTMQIGKEIDQITPSLSAKVNYLLNRRFNSDEAAMLQAKVVPNSNDDSGNFLQKIGNLNRLVSVMQGGDINALRMVASSIAGQTVNPILPSSSSTQSPSNSGSGDPEADAAIQKIQSSGLNPQAKQARINAVRARMRPNG